MTARGLRVLACLAAAGLATCGYSTARLDGLGAGARTIAVRPFENRTFRRDLELELTGRVLDELRARTSYGLASLDAADYVLEGWVSAGEAVGLQRVDREVVLEQYRGRAHAILRDRRSGRVVREYDVQAVTSFTPGAGGESLEGSATAELTRRLAIRIVQGLETGF